MSAARRIDVGGMRIAVEETGQGMPVVLHPGLGYASWFWEGIVPLLAEEYRVLSLDPRGAGRSDKPVGPYSIMQMADDVAAVLRALQCGTAHVLGHSMGGYVAQVLAVRHPAVVRSLLLVSTSPGGPRAYPVPSETTAAWETAAGLTPEDFARQTFSLSFRPGWDVENPSDYESYLAKRLRWPTPPERWRDQFRACEAFLESGIGQGVIDRPALIVHGARDRVVPVANATTLAARFPDNRLVVVPDAGHNLVLEEPTLLAGLVLDFLKTVS